jgi:hypothetical protein
MKTGSALVILAVVLAVFGAGLSYSGYNESLQALTLTSTRSFTVTSTKTIASTSTESIVMTTSSTNWLLEGEVIDLPAAGQHYCGYWGYRSLSLDAGQVHVSYSTDRTPVDFWMLAQGDFTRWNNTRTCEEALSFHGLAHKLGSNAYDLTVKVPSSGEYYFVFLNEDRYRAAEITLNADAGIQQREFTVTTEHTAYSTQQTVFPTQTVTSSEQPAGFGLLFYSGIALIVVAGVILTVSKTRATASAPPRAPSVTQVAPAAQAVSPAPSVQTAGKFCINCGARLPEHATFCNKCGSKQ